MRRRLERFQTDARFRIENLYKIKTQARQIERLRFNEAQLKLYETVQWFKQREFPVRIIICKSRRAGLSTGVEALIFDDTIRTPNTNSLIVANQLKPSTNVLGMCHTFWKMMPPAVKFGSQVIPIRPALPSQYNNKPPTDSMIFEDPLNSRIDIASAKSVDAYLGNAFQNIHCTEAGAYDDAQGLFASVSPTMPDDPETSLYIESTPRGKTGKGYWFYKECLEASLRTKTSYGETKLLFIPWHEMTHSFSKPFKDMSERSAFERSLNSDERDIMKRYTYISLEQMKWRRAKLAQPAFAQDPEVFSQEFPEDIISCFLSSGSSVFTTKSIKRLAYLVREPQWTGDVYWGENDDANKYGAAYDMVRRPSFLSHGQAESRGFGSHTTERQFDNLRVYRWPAKGERLVIAADIGRGNPNTEDGDYSTAGVFVLNEWGKDELIATWRGKLNPILFAEVLATLAWGMTGLVGSAVKKPLLVPEWTGPGSATCTYLDEKNLFTVDRYRMPGVHGMPKSKHIGWESSAKTTPTAVGWMVRMVEQDLIDIPDSRTVEEMSGYRQTGGFGDDGSFEGTEGHDDLVSMLRIGCAILRLERSATPGDSDVVEIDPERGYQDDTDRADAFDQLSPDLPSDTEGGEYEPEDEYEEMADGLFYDEEREW